MSGDAIKAWTNQVTKDDLLRAQNTMPLKRRPRLQNLELVGKHLAECLIDARGYVGETQDQIVASLHVLSLDQVGNCLQALDRGGLWVVIRTGAPGRATHRVFALHDPRDLLQRRGVNPVAMESERRGVDTPTQGGSDETQGGNPVAPKQIPKQNPTPPAATQREQIADSVAAIALRLDQERNGEIKTPHLKRTRTSDYKLAALQSLQHIDLDAVDVTHLAAKLVNQRGQTKLQTTTYQSQPATPQPTVPTPGDTECAHCNGDGWGYVLDDQNVRTTRKCVCIKGTWSGQEYLRDIDPPVALEQRIENDHKVRQLGRTLRTQFTLPPA